MSNLHLWKTKGKTLAKDYIQAMPIKKSLAESGDTKRMREIQVEIGILRA